MHEIFCLIKGSAIGIGAIFELLTMYNACKHCAVIDPVYGFVFVSVYLLYGYYFIILM